MAEVELNWRRAKAMLYILFAFLILFSLLPVVVRNDYSMFLASLTTYGIIFYYLHSRLSLAASENWSPPQDVSFANVFSFMSRLFGGFKKSMLVVLGSAVAGILVVVLASAL